MCWRPRPSLTRQNPGPLSAVPFCVGPFYGRAFARLPGAVTGRPYRTSLPGAGGREGEGGETRGFGGWEPEQAQDGFSEIVDSGLFDSAGLALAHLQ